MTVTAAGDPDGDDDSEQLVHTASGGEYADATATLAVTVYDYPAANASPSFTSPSTFSVDENKTPVGTVTAADSDTDDNVTGYALEGGADQGLFSIDATTGALTFQSAPNFEAPQDADKGNDYVVTVRATSGEGEREKTADQEITVTVSDVDGEAPGKPGAPTVSEASVSSLNVSWSAPDNDGPAITGYGVRYREGDSGTDSGDWTDATHTGTGTTATIAGLSEDTSYQVQVQATNDEGTGAWSDAGVGSTAANASPSFTSPSTFSVDENKTPVGTVTATDSDTDDNVTGYALEGGADQGLFSIDATTGALTFQSAPNFEAPQDADKGNDYVVTVRATSGEGEREKTADQEITVTVSDVDGEAPGKPGAPTVSEASVSSLNVSWSAPDNDGPAITGYGVRYREGDSGTDSGDWTDATHTGTGTTATIAGLSEDTSYQVQVQATNDEGTGAWSDAGVGSTAANASPSFTSPSTFSVDENKTPVGTVTATDSDTDDSVTGYALEGGADQGLFSIDATTGALTFQSAPNFEAPQDADKGNDYVVTVRATSGEGEREKTADQEITVTVSDVDGEAPGKPGAPTVSEASVSSLNVSWSAPDNDGPAITGYGVRYREGHGQTDSGDWTDATHTGTGTTATIAGLSEDTSYQVQVQATNDEGTGAWSDAGVGSTAANASPSFTSPSTFSVDENKTPVGTVTATDSDTDDNVTGYALAGGADRSLFSIDATTGALTFQSAPNFEAPQDADKGNDYVVTVRATSGEGEREKTADQEITVTVSDVDGEAPGKPGAPTVSEASVSSLNVSWSAPDNDGPAITGYGVRYREGRQRHRQRRLDRCDPHGHGDDGDHRRPVGGHLVPGAGAGHQRRGHGGLVGRGGRLHGGHASPSFTSPSTFSVDENKTPVGTVTATDTDTDDNVTGYALEGGADQGLFSIDATTGGADLSERAQLRGPPGRR